MKRLKLAVPEAIAIGILIMSCMPGGTTSNIFTYFSKGNLALSVLMTVTSTVAGVVMIPLVLVLYAAALDLEIPRENIIATLILLLVPVGIGMVLRRINANIGAVTEFFGSVLGVVFILFLIVSWIPRNWQFLLDTSASNASAPTRNDSLSPTPTPKRSANSSSSDTSARSLRGSCRLSGSSS